MQAAPGTASASPALRRPPCRSRRPLEQTGSAGLWTVAGESPTTVHREDPAACRGMTTDHDDSALPSPRPPARLRGQIHDGLEAAERAAFTRPVPRAPARRCGSSWPARRAPRRPWRPVWARPAGHWQRYRRGQLKRPQKALPGGAGRGDRAGVAMGTLRNGSGNGRGDRSPNGILRLAWQGRDECRALAAPSGAARGGRSLINMALMVSSFALGRPGIRLPAPVWRGFTSRTSRSARTPPR